MPNYLKNKVITQVGILQSDVDKNIFNKLTYQNLQNPQALKLLLLQIGEQPDNRPAALRLGDRAINKTIANLGKTGMQNWFVTQARNPKQNPYDLGFTAILYQKAFGISKELAADSPVTGILKDRCIALLWNHPDNFRKAMALFAKYKGYDSLSGFLENPICFYGTLLLLIGAPLLMGLSGGLRLAPKEAAKAYQYKPLTGLLPSVGSYA